MYNESHEFLEDFSISILGIMRPYFFYVRESTLDHKTIVFHKFKRLKR